MMLDRRLRLRHQLRHRNSSYVSSIIWRGLVRFAQDVADRIVFMDGGTIVEEAAPREFFARPQHAAARAFLRLVDHASAVSPGGQTETDLPNRSTVMR